MGQIQKRKYGPNPTQPQREEVKLLFQETSVQVLPLGEDLGGAIRWVLILPFLLLNYIFSFSQTVDWSPPYNTDNKNPYTTILGENTNGLYLLRQNYRQRRRNIIMEQFTTDLKPAVKKEFLTKKDEFLLQIVIKPNGILIYYGAKDKQNKSTGIFVKKLKPDLSPSGIDSLIMNLNDPEPDIDYIQVVKARNYENTIVLAPRIKSEVPQQYYCMIIDSSLVLKYIGEIDMEIKYPYLLEQVAYTDKELSMVVREDVPKKVYKDGFHYSVIYGNLKQNLLKTYPLYNDSINVSEGILKADYVNNQFVFAGLFYMRDSSYSKGYYLWSREIDSQRTMSRAIPFPNDVLTAALGMKGKSAGIYGIRIGDVVLRQDGGIILVTEEYKLDKELQMENNFYGGMPVNNYRYFYYYNDLLILSLDREGKKDWFRKLKKEQVSMNDNGVYSSYLLQAMPDKLVFAFNDLSRKRWLLSSYKINSKGEEESAVLIHPQEYEGRIVPRDGSQVSADEFVMPGFTEKGMVLVRVKF